MTDEPALAVDIAREGDDLAWQVENIGTSDVWVFLLVPSVVDGRLSFAVDTAWTSQEDDGTLLVRKTNAEPPVGRFADVVLSGAICMKPHDRRRGRVTLGDEVALKGAYDGSEERVAVRRVVLEVGWILWQEAVPPELLDWRGQPFAYIDATEDRPQRSTRSAPLEWTPDTTAAPGAAVR